MAADIKALEHRGLFIVIYGANNLGKSEQSRRLSSKLIHEGNQVFVIKYPIYQLEPTGPIINSILRNPDDPNRKISEYELQKLFAQNRRDFQEVLIQLMNAGVHIIAEDYTGTGISWGLTRDVPHEDLVTLNEDLLIPDLAILLDGERFLSGIEQRHRNESDLDVVWEKNRSAHQFLADRHGWKRVNANQEIEQVHRDVMEIVVAEFHGKSLLKYQKK
jgi:thymidylate kinase